MPSSLVRSLLDRVARPMLALLILALCLGYFVRARMQQRAAIPDSRFAVVDVRSNPAGAQVLVDGQPQGLTPMQLYNLSPGVHRIVLRKDGCADWAFSADLRAGANPAFEAQLSPAPPAPPDHN